MLFDFSNPIGPGVRLQSEKHINVILRHFSDSNIRALHCYGRQTYALSAMQAYLPRLTETMETLSFIGSDRITIARGLSILGPTIETLEIRNRSRLLEDENIIHPSGSLRSELPRLTTLRLVNVASTLSELQGLLSSIGRVDGSYSTYPVPRRELNSTLTSLSAIQLFTHHASPQSPTTPLRGSEFYNLIQLNSIASNLTYLWIEPGVLTKYEVQCIWKPSLVTEIVQLCPKLRSFGYTSHVADDLPLRLPHGLRRLSLALCPPVHFMNSSYLHSCQRFIDFVQRVKRLGRVNLEGLELTILMSHQLQQNPGFWRLSFEEVNKMFSSGREELEVACIEDGITVHFETM
ncbi:hypothetical protein BKA70DRAFT_1280743 [Coprinopsis sp. MPI-PUGE-AT-0042]|nr:hypothetical protein BKA70DRAFT_1280743 [Coprinopsis sp. MPI-PUGE-AT-0042]